MIIIRKIFHVIFVCLLLVSFFLGTLERTQAESNFLDVTITAIPSYVAMTNSESSWSLGIVRKNSVYYWTVNETIPLEPFAEEDMKSLITNTGTVSEIIMISATNFVGGTGWILSEVTGSNLVIMSSGVTGDNLTSMRILSDNVSRELYHDIPSKSTFKWCMILSTGTFTDNVEKSSVVTVTAVAH